MRRVGADVLERHPRLKKVVLELLGDEFTCFVVDDVTPEHFRRIAIQPPPKPRRLTFFAARSTPCILPVCPEIWR